MNHKHALDFRRARLAKTAVLARMLRIIHHLPIDALCKKDPIRTCPCTLLTPLASTTLPGLLKIRYVASSLLNDLELVSPGPSDGLSDDDRIKAAHYLCECGDLVPLRPSELIAQLNTSPLCPRSSRHSP